MTFSRGQLLYAALAVAESAWIFAAAAMIGAVLQQGGSPLPWAVVFSVLVLAMFATWLAGDMGGDVVTLALLQGVFGLIVLYGAMAFRAGEGSSTFDALWFIQLLSGDYGQTEILGVIGGFFIAIFLWRRGITLVVSGEAWETLHRTFRIGIAAISIALIAELATDSGIGVRIIIFPFFAASLAGMAIGRVAEEGAWDAASAIWGRVIFAVVGGVIAVGVALGVLGAAFGSGPLGIVVSVLVAIRDGLIWIMEIILTPPVTAFFWLTQWIIDLFGKPIQKGEAIPAGGSPEARELTDGVQMVEEVGDSLLHSIVEILVWPVGILLLLLVLWILVKSFQRLVNEDESESDSDRESIRGDADARSDFANLLGRLIPGFLKRSGDDGVGLRYPADQPGISEVFMLYFRLLTVGVNRGAMLESHLTPAELEGRLVTALPGVEVGQITRRFEAACYGHEPTGEALLSTLSTGLDEVVSSGD